MKDHLKELIASSPQKGISYHDYMDAVLYTPNIGYYVRQKRRLAQKGIFIRPVMLGMHLGGHWPDGSFI